MLIWTLIIIMSGSGSSTNYAIDHIPFHTKEECEIVRIQIQKETLYTNFTMLKCIGPDK